MAKDIAFVWEVVLSKYGWKFLILVVLRVSQGFVYGLWVFLFKKVVPVGPFGLLDRLKVFVFGLEVFLSGVWVLGKASLLVYHVLPQIA